MVVGFNFVVWIAGAKCMGKRVVFALNSIYVWRVYIIINIILRELIWEYVYNMCMLCNFVWSDCRIMFFFCWVLLFIRFQFSANDFSSRFAKMVDVVDREYRVGVCGLIFQFCLSATSSIPIRNDSLYNLLKINNKYIRNASHSSLKHMHETVI